MKRVFSACFTAILILILSAGAYADITADDIYVSDPLSYYLVVGNQSYLAANIKNFTPDTGIGVRISQRFSVVTDEDILKMTLPVSKVTLVAPTVQTFDKKVNLNRLLSKEDMKTFEAEIKETILNYFKYKNMVDSFVDTKTVQSKEETEQVKSEFSFWRTKYQSMFEKQVFSDVIQSPSYYTSLGWLEPGAYTVRFVNHEGYVIKEFFIEVVKQPKNIEYNLQELTPSVIGIYK